MFFVCLSLSPCFTFYNSRGLPSKLKSYTYLHLTIPSSPPIALTTFPELIAFAFGGRKTHSQSHFSWGLGGGGGQSLFYPIYCRLFEIKLPSVQIVTCAMLGCYLGLAYPVVSGRVPVSFSLELGDC